MKKDIRRKYERSRRFWAGIREITVYHYAKLLIPLAYLLVLFLVWKICISAFSVLSKNEIVVRSVLIKKYLESIENTNFIDRRPRKQVEKGHYLKR